MGGDFAPEATTLGAILAKKELGSSVELVLLGDESEIVKILEREGENKSDFTIIHTDQVIEMGEHPARALSKNPNSSISVGFELLRRKEIDGFGSAGNSGAMLVGSMLTVKPVPGVIRPCILSALPKEDGSEGIILDVGINADCKPDVLNQFALLGSLYAQNVCGIENPKVGLLNIGEESEKGNLLTQATYYLMNKTKEFNFIGNVEGRDIFGSKADVIVCDGFTGNVVLKEAEAFYSLIARRGLLDDYFKRFNYENYGGTPVLGVNAPVMIGHGISSPKAIKNLLCLTKEIVHSNLSDKIKEAFV